MAQPSTISVRKPRSLQDRFGKRLIGPSDDDYEDARHVWNGSIDRRPALIARCVDQDDVVLALAAGRALDLPIAVRSGGHSFPGLSVCDDGLVIDLRSLKRITIDPVDRTVRVGAGVLLGELDAATQAHGLAVPVGSVSHTGVAGLTLGGGFGWLMRRLGLTIDQLIAVELVTADGAMVEASDAEHPDLFWAVRGGGGNFGIATALTFRLHPVGPTVLAGILLWPLERGLEVARAYREWSADAPDDLTTALVLRRAPPIAAIPSELHGRPVIAVACCWSGPMLRGTAILEPMRRVRGAVDIVGPRPFLEHQRLFDPSYPHGIWIHSKAADVRSLSHGLIDTLLDHAALIDSPGSGIVAWQLGGAVARVDEGSTAFGGRAAGHLVDVLGATDGPAGFPEAQRWARDAWGAISSHGTGVYVNWLMEEGDARVRAAYGADRFARLQRIKRQYDPDNVFRGNQNIPPA